MMSHARLRVKIWGASTLEGFTGKITEGFRLEQVAVESSGIFDCGLVQLHGSPQAKDEDERLLAETSKLEIPKIYLIHRPDEIISNSRFVSCFENDEAAQFILLGDLVLEMPFWAKRTSRVTVIPHPYLDFSMPPREGRAIVGSFTSWGEMRKLEHFVRLAEALKGAPHLQFKIGGTGLDRAKVPSFIEITENFFVPHFNVQLYHLNGRKRFGESSGSLHRGVSIPVIFEANGMERLENIMAIKVAADDDLNNIDFAQAASQIAALDSLSLHSWLEHNKRSAVKNSPQAFARAVLRCFHEIR
jgi:hypothetical protein